MKASLHAFGNTAKTLARNPLGIIALFIVLIYGFAALTLGLNTSILPAERLPLVWFLVLFPIIVLFTFGWLVSRHHEKLYAPADYKSDEGFLRGMESRIRHTQELQVQQGELKAKIRKTLSSSTELSNNKRFQELLDEVTDEIDKATTISVDARQFLSDQNALFILPVAAFETLADLTNDVYFKLLPKVKAFEYGHSWLFREKISGKIIKNVRMIMQAPSGKPLTDNRTLAEVGIFPGMVLSVESPLASM